MLYLPRGSELESDIHCCGHPSCMGANRCEGIPVLTECSPFTTGDAFLILASDGLLQAAMPDEVCGLADALASGMPLPKPLTAAPITIPLGPSAAAGLPSQQPLVAPSKTSNCTGSDTACRSVQPGQLERELSILGTPDPADPSPSCRPCSSQGRYVIARTANRTARRPSRRQRRGLRQWQMGACSCAPLYSHAPMLWRIRTAAGCCMPLCSHIQVHTGMHGLLTA